MEAKAKTQRKKKAKKDNYVDGYVPKSFEALEELTSSDVVEQLKMGLSRMAPLEEPDDNEEPKP